MPEPPGKQFGPRIEAYLDPLFRAACRLTGNTPDAQDLVQDTCVKAFRNAKAFNECESPLGWLMRVQYNVFVDAQRRKKRLTARTIDEAETAVTHSFTGIDPAATAATSEWMDQVQAAFAKLSAKQRALLALRVEGYSLMEMSEITGLKITVINARLHRARQSMARHLKELAVTGVPTQRGRVGDGL